MAVTETTLYEQRDFSIFQNRMYASAEAAPLYARRHSVG